MNVVNFRASNFERECNVDEEFAPLLNQMNDIAIRHNMVVVINSSLRKDTNVRGAIVIPAQMSNHLVGHAIDCNVKSKITGEFFNSKKMGDGTGIDELFLEDVDRNTDLRWGQAFHKPDSVHFDDALNIKRPAIWRQKFNSLHNIG
ncbi:MAG: M15 family metallopeptidase [Ginsengibacter sp.]